MAGKNTGSEKAAILLLAFGENIASEIFKHMTENEIRQIGSAMSQLERVDNELIETTIEEFHTLLQSEKQYYLGGEEYAKKLISSAFQTDRATALIDELSFVTKTKMESIEHVEPKTLALFLRHESPQTIALILAHLEPAKFAETLRLLPESQHADLILRVSHLESVSPDLVREIDEVLKQELPKMGRVSASKMGGIEPVVGMINRLDKGAEENLLNELEKQDPQLVEHIRKLKFVFDDLVKIDDRSMQILLREVKTDQLKLALKTASEAVKELIFKNMSQKAAENLKEEFSVMGPAKISDVEQAQFSIVQIARKLSDEGKIVIVEEGSGDLV